jgi:hypothetical protein
MTWLEAQQGLWVINTAGVIARLTRMRHSRESKPGGRFPIDLACLTIAVG